MSKLIKIAAILGIAALVIAAKQLSPLGTGTVPTVAATAATSISPAELTRGIGPLAETQIDSLY